MSLLAWYPLIKDGKNQGLDGIDLTQTGTITYTAGKIGNSATFNQNLANRFTRPQIKIYDNFSFSCWFKLQETTSTTWQTLFFEGRDVNNDGWGFRINGGNKRLVCCCGSTVWTYGVDISYDKWYHATMTIDNGNWTVYFDGSKVGNGTVTTLPKLTEWNTTFFVGCLSGSYYPLNGQVQDVRIYDHPLSAKEVKEISKGLCIHYQLKGTGANENLLVNSSEWFNNSISYNANSCKVTREISYNDTCFLNKQIKITLTNSNTTTNYGATGIYIGASTQLGSDWANKLIEGETYTYSFWAKADASNPYNIGLSSGGIIENQTHVANTGFGSLTTIWRYHTVTFKWTKTTKLTACFYITVNASSTVSFYLCGFKLEKGSKATPWIPNPADTLYTQLGYNSNIEPDCSGFGFDGTITGSLPTNINSPKYNTCRTFGSDKYIRTDKGFPLGAQPPFTISLWYKPVETTYVTWADVVRCGVKLNTTTALWRMECYNNTGLNYAWYGNGVVNNGGASCSWTAEYNKWHHLVQTFDGTIFRQYVNGTQVGTYTLASAYVGFETTGTFGVGDYGMYGDMSDIRVYATCLTPEDVKELYNTSASIDKKGNFICCELEEV